MVVHDENYDKAIKGLHLSTCINISYTAFPLFFALNNSKFDKNALTL